MLFSPYMGVWVLDYNLMTPSYSQRQFCQLCQLADIRVDDAYNWRLEHRATPVHLAQTSEQIYEKPSSDRVDTAPWFRHPLQTASKHTPRTR